MPNLLSIAVSGLNDAVLRAANAASNIVNASSTGKLPTTPGGKSTAFEPKDVVTVSVAGDGTGLGVTSILKPRDPAYVTAPDPTSRNANKDGLVAVPNVDINAELVALKSAGFAYGADAALIKVQRRLDKSLLDALS